MSSNNAPSRPPSNQPESARSGPGVRVDPQGVYLILSGQGRPDVFHWGVFISQTDQVGILYHQALRGSEWTFVMESQDVSSFPDLLVALKVGCVDSIEEQWMQYYRDRIRETKVTKEFRCKNWALAAVRELADSGVIGLQPNEYIIDRIEEEAFRYARDNYLMNVKRVYLSQHCVS
ncbi:hypothetical protein PRK78_004356 [Emydomyces testavorans]|uniref:Uncharacterized protein n=1 Tax=Emydomyces testavorans TaxID=2070801 RepID=A0AAF0IJ66_9EURO|nr:hypothetical protein PRK78_004356 [Emydomyces testavorans]